MRWGVWCVLASACGYAQPQRPSDAASGSDAAPRDGAVPGDGALRDAPDAAGGPACSVALSCTAPANGTQTICGQLYDVELGSPFTAAAPTGAACGTATDGPCALQMTAYDALTYLQSPTTTTPLAIGTSYVDDCGRFELQEIVVPSGPIIAIVVDDRASAAAGPAGATNTVMIAMPKAANTVANGVEHWIATNTTTSLWTQHGAPAISGGLYVPMFRAHVAGATDPFAEQAGVVVTKSGTALPGVSYFLATETTRQTIDPAATATGADGSAVFAGASVGDGLAYSGSGGLQDPTSCRWESHFAQASANLVFVQIYRPIAQIGKTCSQ